MVDHKTSCGMLRPMRGLTPAEEEALLLVLEHDTGQYECRYCTKTDADFSISDAVFLALRARGLLDILPCEVNAGHWHALLTLRGRLVLNLAAAERSFTG